MPVLSDCSQSPHRALVLTSVYGPGLLGAQGNSTALVGTPEQVVDALLDYHDLGVTTFLIRGFDPLEDAIRYGRDLLPLTRDLIARQRPKPAYRAAQGFSLAPARFLA
jgi:alkanesulfonate monooxygenase SsuD/methylene tetrahydromethanopterin reductase-like flavin-dependent oxidoreductase (luciferase family)